MGHVVFDANFRQLTPDGSPGAGVYEWDHGELRFVSVLPDGTPAPLGFAGARDVVLQQTFHGDNVISDDGRRIFFTAGDAGLYVREDASTTRLISGSERSGDDPNSPLTANFQTAKADDGSAALFTSPFKLTADATAGGPDGSSADLYLWRAEPDADGKHLIDLTTGDLDDGGGVLGIAAAADDLSHVYFVARGDQAPGARPGQPNLYVWTEGEGVRHVATLDGSEIPGSSGIPRDQAVWSIERTSSSARYRDARVSADGSRLLFSSHAPLTSHDNDGHRQVYLYDADADQLDCVSCSSSLPSATGDADLFPLQGRAWSPNAPLRLPRNLSADGRTAFFETAQKLVDADANGKPDVYAWVDGDLRLMSSGQSGEGSEFIDASASGDDVFFTTRERLVGADQDDQIDVYDARVGGGFPEQQLPPACQGDACQGQPSGQPSAGEPGSSTLQGRGDVRPGRRAAFAPKRLSARQRAKLARGRTVVLRVKVNRPGKVSASGKARVGKRLRTVVRASRVARRPGTVSLRLRLSKPALGRLRAGQRLRLSLSIHFAGALEPKTQTLRLKPRRGGPA